MLANKRPIYLNLFKIRLPITGMVSLAHRASAGAYSASVVPAKRAQWGLLGDADVRR